MKILLCMLTVFLSCGADIETDEVYCKPEQVHVAYGDTASEMVVMWSTVHNCTTEVMYGVNEWDSEASRVDGTVELMPGGTSNVPYIHRATLKGLQPNMTYFYIPLSNNISSDNIFFFKTQSLDKDWQPDFLVYGDLGVHSQSLPKLNLEAIKGSHDAVLHVGDIAYDLFDTINEGPLAGKNVGDVFMQRIQEMASHVPYMVSPGNHEIENGTFYQYRYRYSTPHTDWPIPLDHMFYSMDIGPVHIISYSSEVFFVANGQYAEAQKKWLQQDLEKANKNRDFRPWVIAMGHRPMYCSNGDGDDCTKPDSLVRAGLEDMFYEGGVDVVIQAHEHNYERLWPMYKGQVLAQNYSDPAAPVQLITGAAGTIYGPGLMNMSIHEPWSAFRLLNKSFNSVGRLKVFNHTHLYWEQKGVLNGELIDSIWITQHWHAPFTSSRTLDNRYHGNNDNNNNGGQTDNLKPDTAGDSLTAKVTKAIKGIDVKLAVGVISGLVVLVIFVIAIIMMRRRKKRNLYRRWEAMDEKSYKHLQEEEEEMEEVEIYNNTQGKESLIGGSID